MNVLMKMVLVVSVMSNLCCEAFATTAEISVRPTPLDPKTSKRLYRTMQSYDELSSDLVNGWFEYRSTVDCQNSNLKVNKRIVKKTECRLFDIDHREVIGQRPLDASLARSIVKKIANKSYLQGDGLTSSYVALVKCATPERAETKSQKTYCAVEPF
jgi:hypothetical protein